MRPLRKNRLALEQLEDRHLMAGNVNAFTQQDSNGISLYINGDDNENRITVESIGFNRIQVRGFSDTAGQTTAVNGGANALVAFTVTNGVFIHMYGGNDLVRVTNLGIRGGLLVDLGSGNDSTVLGRDQPGGDIRFGNTTTGQLSVARNLLVVGGSGNDFVYMSQVRIGNDAQWELGAGNDSLLIRRPLNSGQNVEVFGNAEIDSGNGADSIDLLGFIADNAFLIDDTLDNFFGFSNTVNITLNAVDLHGQANIITDDFADNITISATRAYSQLQIDTGSGTNTVRFSGIADTLSVAFGDNADALYLEGCSINTLFANANGGNDLFSVAGAFGNNATFDGGFGTDQFVSSTTKKSLFSNLKVYSVP